MKKTLLALAALTAFAGAASAQSSVTLFGVVDLSVGALDNGRDSKYMMMSDGNASSRFGVRGVEDLGGGLKAGFWLEAGLAADDGTVNTNLPGLSTTSGQFWNRRATVQLSGNWGEVRLGRDYTPQFWNITVFDPFGTNGVGSSLNLVAGTANIPGSNVATIVRADNTMGYFLPAMGGFYGQFMVAAGEGAPQDGRPANKMYGGRLGYAAGPINVAGAWAVTEATQDVTNWNIGGSWNFGFMTLMGWYQNIAADNSAALDQTSWLVGATMPFGAMTLKASYGATDRDSNVGGCVNASGASSTAVTSCDASQWAIGLTYDLSKRTSLYAAYASMDNSGTLLRVSGNNNALAARNDTYTGYQFGVRHTF